MPEYLIQTTQEFHVTYRVVADSPDEAWERLNDSGFIADCDDQMPGDITGTLDDSSWMQPSIEVFTRTAQPWAPHIAEAPQFETMPQG